MCVHDDRLTQVFTSRRRLNLIMRRANICTGLLAIAFSGALSTWGQQRGERADAKKSAIKEQDDLIATAYTLPPEFAADTLVTLATTVSYLTPKKRQALLDDAYNLAGAAQSTMRREAFPGSSVDTRSGYLDIAYAQGLDTLSLRAKVVQAMVAVNRTHAADMLGQLAASLEVPRVGCSQLLTYNVDEYYRALEAVLRQALSAEHLTEERRLRLLTENIGAVSSAVQIAPLSKAILTVHLDDDDLRLVLSLLGTRLADLSADPLSFVVVQRNVLQHVAALARAARQRQIPNTVLFSGLRRYIITNAAAPQCGAPAARKRLQQTFTAIGDHFNSVVAALAFPLDAEVDSLPKDLLHVTELSAAGTPESYWTTSDAKTLLVRVQQLNEKANPAHTSGSERSRAELDTLNAINSWPGTSERTVTDYFHQKCVLFRTLHGSATSDSIRERVFDAYLAFLELHDTDIPRTEWFMHVRDLLPSSHLTGHVPSFDKLLNARSSVVAMYTKLQRSSSLTQR